MKKKQLGGQFSTFFSSFPIGDGQVVSLDQMRLLYLYEKVMGSDWISFGLADAIFRVN